MRVIAHPHPFILLGADVLSGGRDSKSWNFTGMKVKTDSGGEVSAQLTFDVNRVEVGVDLAHAPSSKGAPPVGNLSYVGGSVPLASG